MSFSSYIAVRYLKSSRENRFFSWIAVLSIAGIAISVAAMIVVLSVINGFKTELRTRFLSANAHILAYRYPAGMENPDQWADIIRQDFKGEVVGISPFVHSETMVRAGSIMQSVLIRGLNPSTRESVQSLKTLIQPPSALVALQQEIDDKAAGKPLPDMPGVVLGTGLLHIIDAKVGDTLQIVAPTSEEHTELKKFRIIGTYYSGLKNFDNRIVVLSLVAAQKLCGMDGLVTGLEIGLKNPDDSPAVALKMQDKYTLQIREWQSFNRPLFEAIQMERGVIFLLVTLIALVASFNILTTLFVSVTQKQREVSILKALGASNRQIVTLFINQGIYMGIVGGLIGLGLALGISKLLEKYKFIDLPDPYFLSTLPINYDGRVYAAIAILSVSGCIIAAVFPAYVAAKVDPVQGFKGTGNAF